MIILVSNIDKVFDKIRNLIKIELNRVLFIPSTLSKVQKTKKYVNEIVELLKFHI